MTSFRDFVLLNLSDSERLLALTVLVLRIRNNPRGSDGIAYLIGRSGAEAGVNIVDDTIETELVRNTHSAHEEAHFVVVAAWTRSLLVVVDESSGPGTTSTSKTVSQVGVTSWEKLQEAGRLHFVSFASVSHCREQQGQLNIPNRYASADMHDHEDTCGSSA